MTKRSLIIGMGIGQLYKTVLTNLGHEVITVDMDPEKGADFTTVKTAILKHSWFETVHICTPNFTHFSIAEEIAPYAKIVFIEKPGVETSEIWSQMVRLRPFTRFMMVKNNMWRSNMPQLKNMAEKAMTINLRWVNKDRVPSPGSWFTTKELAYGGVSRDLMPHLLSLFAELDPNFYHATNKKVTVDQRWKLSDLLNTEYGKVDPNGVCNVDDFCYLEYENNNRRWLLTADWRSLGKDVRHIQFIYPDDTYDIVELGLCPEDAYQNMIQSALDHVYDADFWRKQLNCDLWIHEQIEKL